MASLVCYWWGWARSARISDLTPEGFLRLLGEICPITGNPLDQLAMRLREKLPQLFV